MWTPLNKMRLQKGKIDISLRLLELYSSKCLFLSLTGGEAVLTATYLINKSSSRVLNGVSPIQLITTYYPSVPLMTSCQSRVFGCPLFVHVHGPHREKLDPQAIKCVFIGYASNKKGYNCYHPQSLRVYVSKDVTFHETKSFFTSPPIQGESSLEVEILELSCFPLLQDFTPMEDDKDPEPASSPIQHKEDKHFGNQYQRRKNPTWSNNNFNHPNRR